MGKKRILLLDIYGVIIKESIISGEIRMRKPENRIFVYAIKHLQCNPQECIFVDNSMQNLNSAQEAGINTGLFNRDNEVYSGEEVKYE